MPTKGELLRMSREAERLAADAIRRAEMDARIAARAKKAIEAERVLNMARHLRKVSKRWRVLASLRIKHLDETIKKSSQLRKPGLGPHFIPYCPVPDGPGRTLLFRAHILREYQTHLYIRGNTRTVVTLVLEGFYPVQVGGYRRTPLVNLFRVIERPPG